MTEQAAADRLPRRELRDPRALRALAHPVRLQLLEEVAQRGRATATELAEATGESPANCSWHLRQLAQYGFIEEAEGGAGRQRPWRMVAETTVFGRDEAGGELDRAGSAATDVLLERQLAALRSWFEARSSAPEEWQHAGFVTQSLDWLTAAELAAFREEMHELVERHLMRRGGERLDPANRPAGARLVRFVAWATPGTPPPEGGTRSL